jgi:hypothetical protein
MATWSFPKFYKIQIFQNTFLYRVKSIYIRILKSQDLQTICENHNQFCAILDPQDPPGQMAGTI